MSAPLLTVREAAIQLGIHWKTLYHMVQQKAIAVVRIGGSLRFRPEDLDAYIVAHRQPAKSERKRPVGWISEPVIDETFQ